MNVTFCLWPIPGDVFSPPTNSEALPPPRHPCVVLDLATDGSGEAQLVSGLKVAPRDGEQNTAEQTTHGWAKSGKNCHGRFYPWWSFPGYFLGIILSISEYSFPIYQLGINSV